MVVNNFMKHGYNQGREEMLFFYRDKSQREVDIMRVLTPDRVEAYEVKAAQTFQTRFFDNLNYLRPLLGDRLQSTMVIYDGQQENPQRENGFLNFRHLF